jgi:hypothetical protein
LKCTPRLLTGVDQIDYRSEQQRMAIGRSLVFLLHMERENFKDSKEYQSALDFLKREYGESNTANFQKEIEK